MAGREYGPIRLGSLDTLVAVNALRFVVGGSGLRASFWFILLALLFLVVGGVLAADSGMVFIGGVSALALFVVIPMMQGRRRNEFFIEITDRGLLVRTGQIETLYRKIEAGRIRHILGRLLIPVTGRLVVVVPIAQVGIDVAGAIEREALALPFG